MKLIKFKKDEKRINVLFLGDDDSQISFKIRIDELNGEVKDAFEILTEKWDTFANNTSSITGFSINAKEPETVSFDIEIPVSGMIFTAKSEGIEISFHYNSANRVSKDFVELYDFIQVEFCETLYRFATDKMPKSVPAPQYKLFATK